MAAIPRAFAPHRLPISARSRNGCRLRKQRCWLPCRNRRKRAGSTAIRTTPAQRATAYSTAWWKSIASPRKMPIRPPHSADQATSASKDQSVIKLTLDANLQKVLEPLAHDRALAIGPYVSVAIVVVDNASGEILARVGSADYFDYSRAGQVDMTRAVRSPGSTLKPFIYGLAFEDGFVHPESLIDDRPIR